MIAKIEKVELKMWEKKELPEAKRGADGKIEKDEKGKIVNTGNKVEYTEYLFRDLVGEVFKIMSKDNSHRDKEGKVGTLEIDVTRKEFMGKVDTRVSLKGFTIKTV